MNLNQAEALLQLKKPYSQADVCKAFALAIARARLNCHTVEDRQKFPQIARALEEAKKLCEQACSHPATRKRKAPGAPKATPGSIPTAPPHPTGPSTPHPRNTRPSTPPPPPPTYTSPLPTWMPTFSPLEALANFFIAAFTIGLFWILLRDFGPDLHLFRPRYQRVVSRTPVVSKSPIEPDAPIDIPMSAPTPQNTASPPDQPRDFIESPRQEPVKMVRTRFHCYPWGKVVLRNPQTGELREFEAPMQRYVKVPAGSYHLMVFKNGEQMISDGVDISSQSDAVIFIRLDTKRWYYSDGKGHYR